MLKKACQTSSYALKKKCIIKLDSGRGILISRRPKTAEYNNKSLLWRAKRQLYNNSFSDFREESQNWRCKLEAKAVDFFKTQHLNYGKIRNILFYESIF